jgi:hypothetical protein
MKLNLILLLVLALLPIVAQGRLIKGGRLLPAGGSTAGNVEESDIKSINEEATDGRRRCKYAAVSY